VQLHIVDAPLGAGPESILMIVVMDSASPRNDDGYVFAASFLIAALIDDAASS
jgi:hypothetical protein